MRQIREEKAFVEGQIAAASPGLSKAGIGDDKKEEFKKLLAISTTDLQNKLKQVAAMKGQIYDLLAHEETYRRTKETLSRYRFASKKVEDIICLIPTNGSSRAPTRLR